MMSGSGDRVMLGDIPGGPNLSGVGMQVDNKPCYFVIGLFSFLHIDGGSGPGQSGAGTSESAVFGRDALSNPSPTPRKLTRSRIWNFTVPEGVAPSADLVTAGTAQHMGWFVFPWQLAFQYAFKPSDVMAFTQNSCKWRVSEWGFEIDNIQPTMEFKTQTSSSFQFPNIYFEMYEDKSYQLPIYDSNFFNYHAGAQSNQPMGSADTKLKEWLFRVRPEYCQFLSGSTPAFSLRDLELYNGEGLSFVRQIDTVKRIWKNPDSHWRHSAMPYDMAVPFAGQNGYTGQGGGVLPSYRCTFPMECQMFGGTPGNNQGYSNYQFTARNTHTGQTLGFDKDQTSFPSYFPIDSAGSAITSEGVRIAPHLGGRFVARDNTDTGTTLTLDPQAGCMQDWMSGVPFYTRPPYAILMRAVDPTTQSTTTWSFKCKFHCTIEMVESQFRYWPLGDGGEGVAGTTSYEFATPPAWMHDQVFNYGNQATRVKPRSHYFWGTHGNWQNHFYSLAQFPDPAPTGGWRSGESVAETPSSRRDLIIESLRARGHDLPPTDCEDNGEVRDGADDPNAALVPARVVNAGSCNSPDLPVDDPPAEETGSQVLRRIMEDTDDDVTIYNFPLRRTGKRSNLASASTSGVSTQKGSSSKSGSTSTQSQAVKKLRFDIPSPE